MIELIGINKIYKRGTKTFHALRDINLHVKARKIFGVIGASGAGKSTLIRTINLLEQPSSGEVIVNGYHMTRLDKEELSLMRRKIGMIFQHFNLLSSRTVFQNIALPLELENSPKEKIHARVNELLNLVGLCDRAHAYPSQLSGGQKQRVAIARALASSPKVLLCDEATSSLDPQTTRSILSLLKEINAQLGLTILLITHEMDVVKSICDEVAIINEGHIVEQGAVSWFFGNAKTDLARNFIESTFQLKIPEEYLTRISSEPMEHSFPLVKLGFTGTTVNKPLISEASRIFEIDINILSADIEYAGGTKFGYLLAELVGESHQCEAARRFFIEHHVQLETLGYVTND
ncbi:MAG: methionine ABC transporter ATP-binding protein MetN [Verrucomicrobia bacterium]|jgi:D-methionine transport system ATP-binding protein|nr:MAG: methionine ABC transporter ATP-binding protein MetN [Verrucomicrobiota bacterium]